MQQICNEYYEVNQFNSKKSEFYIIKLQNVRIFMEILWKMKGIKNQSRIFLYPEWTRWTHHSKF